MEQAVLLKIQLAEAAKYARSRRFAHKRLAVILLDNFIEIQLRNLIEQKFSEDDSFHTFMGGRKYDHEYKQKVHNHHDYLLKACVKENIITDGEARLISFCHDVRNSLYHKGKEEHVLTEVAINILHNLIVKYQPSWKTARWMFGFYSGSKEQDDPFPVKGKERDFFYYNSEDAWKEFLSEHFRCVYKRRKTASTLLSESHLGKLRMTRQAISFIKKNRDSMDAFLPWTHAWDFNYITLYYSFRHYKRVQIQITEDHPDKKEGMKQFGDLLDEYEKNWRPKYEKRLKALEKGAKDIAKLPIEKALTKYISHKDDIMLYYVAWGRAAADLDGAIQHAGDIVRGK